MSAAFHALDAIDPTGELSLAVERAGARRKVFRLLDAYTNEVQKEVFLPPDDDSSENKQIVIPWFQLQRTLLQAFSTASDASEKNNDLVFLNHELESIDENSYSELMRLTFTNQDTAYHAKIVIGADGNLSKVRALLLDEVWPEYAGACIWRMFLRGDYEDIELGESNVWSGDGKVLGIQKMMSGEGDDEDEHARVYVSGQSGWPEEDLHVLDRRRYIGAEDGQNSGGTTRNKARVERFVSQFQDFPALKQVVQFVKEHHDSASILEHPIYFRPPGRSWGKGRATLIGDAAHMIPPNMAMGTPLALEDAVALAHSVARHGFGVEALRAYELERHPRVNHISEAAIRLTGLYYKDKDDGANPFKMNDKELWGYIMDFQQDPLPSSILGSVSEL